MYWEAILYQCLFFIIFLSKWSLIYANDDTTIESDKLENFEGRIVNGSLATFGKFPYIVSLRRASSMSMFCSGSLIRDNWVLSAAHCMFLKQKLIWFKSVMVVGGDIKLNPASPHRQKRLGKQIIVHPKFGAKFLMNDIALFLLETPFEINQYLKTIQWQLTMPPANTMCRVSGWGRYLKGQDRDSNDLRYLEIPLLSTAVCKKYYSPKFAPSKLCAGVINGGSGSCNGDSGGPLECDGLLTGVVSGGLECSKPGPPGIYTKIPVYVDWINEYIGTDDTTTDSATAVSATVDSATTDSATTTISINYGVIVHAYTFLYLCISLFI